jgi:hypothetical protein
VTDNVLVHSKSKFGGFVQLTAKKRVKQVEFVVCDSGIGIPQSLGSSGLKISSDVDALAQAIEQGVTRDKAVGQGNGLYGSYQIANKSGGQFSLHSGHATLYYTANTGMHTKIEMVPIVGTLVVCAIDYTSPLLLEKALRFGGKDFQTVDMIEAKYEMNPDNIIDFKLKGETDSLGSRIAGTPVRNKIKNLINLSPTSKIVVDFSDIHLVSSSFADEVFGKLFLDLGALTFTSRLEFRRLDPTVRQIIDRAIMQRVSVGAKYH